MEARTSILTEKLLANLQSCAERGETKRRVVLVSTGAYCPIHRMHIEVFERIKTFLEENYDFAVVGGYISPSHDSYVQGKLRSSGWSSLPAVQRLALVDVATKNSSWLSTCSWETEQSGFTDYDAVTRKIAKVCSQLVKEHKKQVLCEAVQVFYVCGSDHALKCGLYDQRARRGWCDGAVVMSRPSGATNDDISTLKRYETKENDFIVVPTTTEDISSTLIRELMAAEDWDKLSLLMDPAVLECMKSNYITFKKLNFK